MLADLMPWSVAPWRLGRAWPMAPDAASLKARWAAFLRAGGAEREALLRPSRSRTLHGTVAQLPGQRTATVPLADTNAPCPEPVRVLRGPFDAQWLLPDHRLIDAARPELWRVADARQRFLVEQGRIPGTDGPVVLATALLPTGHSPAGRPGRIRPLYRRPGGLEPNLAPGLLDLLARRYGQAVTPEEFLAWALAASTRTPAGTLLALPADPALWADGVDWGLRALGILVPDGARKPKLPGGRRPYVRAPVPARPDAPHYDAEEETLHLGTGRISPVPRTAWEFSVSGVRVLEQWCEQRAPRPEPEPLEAVGPADWPQTRTSELLELITVLALLAELEERRPEQDPAETIGVAELREAGVLPVSAASRRPASVLDHREEGPGGQFALL